MANLVESSLWEPGIYQWETTDPVQGGAGGKDNLPTRQLANRTAWLKDQVALRIVKRILTTAQALPSGSSTPLTFAEGTRVTLNRAGEWLVIGMVSFTGLAGGGRFVRILKDGVFVNGSPSVGGEPGAATGNALQVVGTISSNGSTYIEIAAFQDSGSLLHAGLASFLTAVWLGE